MEKIKYCSTCGQKIRGRWEGLSQGIVRDLVKLAKRVTEKQKNEVHLQKELDLTKNQYNNFQKLRYFGLSVKVVDNPGYWLITKKGLEFLRGEIEVNKQVYVKENRVIEYSDKMISIGGVLKEMPYWIKKDDYVNNSFDPQQEKLV